MKFTVVKEEPVELKAGEYVIKTPDFIEEIRDSKLRVAKAGQEQLTKNNMMRNALVLIGMRHMEPGAFNAFRVPLGKYEGLPYKTEQDISDILVRIINNHAPELVDSSIVKSIHARPKDAKFIYFVGPESKAHLFLENGLDYVGQPISVKSVVEQASAS